MRVSLITVCYNAEKTIADAMASVAKQRMQNVRMFEWVKEAQEDVRVRRNLGTWKGGLFENNVLTLPQWSAFLLAKLI